MTGDVRTTQPNGTLSSHTHPRSAAAFLPSRRLPRASGRTRGRGFALVVSVTTGAVAVWAAWTGMQLLELGPSPSAPKPVPASLIASRANRLDGFQRQLDDTLAKKPPALPKIPKFPPVKPHTPRAARTLVATPTPVQVLNAQPQVDTHEDDHETESNDN
jgi:hypothetical protein